MYTRSSGRCLSFQPKTKKLNPILEFIRVVYNRSALLDLYFFKDKQELEFLTDWYSEDIPLNFKTDPKYPATWASMRLKVSRDSTGNTQCKNQGGTFVNGMCYDTFIELLRANKFKLQF